MASPKFRFAIFDLNSCLELAKAVYDNGGLLSSAELADRLGYKSDNNGSFNTRLANARLFGLLDGPSSAIKVSDRAMTILHPDYPAAAARARLDAFETVPLYKAVLDQYHGQQLPEEEGLRNALTTRWEIAPEKAQMVLARLLESADQAGLFTAGGRTKMIRPTLPTGQTAHDKAPALQPNHQPPPAPNPASTTGVRANKLIEGVLEMLPDDQQWDEANLAHWLRFFEDALRLYYRLPAEGNGSARSRGAAGHTPAGATE